MIDSVNTGFLSRYVGIEMTIRVRQIEMIPRVRCLSLGTGTTIQSLSGCATKSSNKTCYDSGYM